jgi:hypothetical protein
LIFPKVFPPSADITSGMTISGTSGSTVLSQLTDASPEQLQTGVIMLKKEQDLMKQQGEAMINMLEQIPTGLTAQGLDVYA